MNRVLTKLTELDRRNKRALQMLADAALMVLCFVIAMTLRLESIAFLTSIPIWLSLLPAVMGTLVLFHFLDLYRSVIRYINAHVLRAIMIGVFASALFLFTSSQILSAPVPRSVPGIYALLLFFTTSRVRFLMQSLFRKNRQRDRQPVIIYGAGEAGRQLATALEHDCE